MSINYKNILSNVYCQLYELNANISHECIMGRLDVSNVDWIIKTIEEIEGYIYEKSNCSKS